MGGSRRVADQGCEGLGRDEGGEDHASRGPSEHPGLPAQVCARGHGADCRVPPGAQVDVRLRVLLDGGGQPEEELLRVHPGRRGVDVGAADGGGGEGSGGVLHRGEEPGGIWRLSGPAHRSHHHREEVLHHDGDGAGGGSAGGWERGGEGGQPGCQPRGGGSPQTPKERSAGVNICWREHVRRNGEHDEKKMMNTNARD